MDRSAVKVCHFTSAHQANDVRIFHKECVSLAQAGFRVYLVAANTEEQTINGVQIVSAGAPQTGRLSRMLKTSRAVYKKALSLDADVYHFHDPELLPYGLKLQRLGKKVIYDSHEDLPRQISGKHWIPRIFRGVIARMVEVYENYVNRRLSFVVAATPTIRERFVKVNPSCTDICNYPLLHEITELPDWNQRKQEVCYIGGISAIRGVREAVAALEDLPQVRLNLAGAFSPPAFREELIYSPGWKQVNELGFVDRQAIAAILNRSKVGIVTLYPQSNYLESLPIKMFEYMLAGIPVIASDFPLWQQIVTENQCGVCVDPKDIAAVSKAINELLSNDEASRIMGQNGRKAVLEKFNWDIERQKLIALYDSLVFVEQPAVERSTVKVCHFTSAHPSDDVRIFHKECVSLAEAGFDVYLVAANAEEKTVDDVKIVSANVPKTGRFSRMLKTSRAVYKKARSLDADIYHFHDPELLPYAWMLKRKGKKVIYDAHEDVPKQILGKFWINKHLRTTVAVSFRTFENIVARRLDYVFTATPFIRDRFAKINRQSTDINNFPLLSELLDETDWNTKANEVCYIGGITQIRGSEQLVDSMELLPEVRLNLAGNYSPASFEKLLKSKPGWKQVNEYGFVSRKETAEIMAKSRVGIVTFLPLPNHVDAQPNKMFEYMSAGIPVIGSDFPLWKDILVKNDCGICVDPENPEAIAAAVKTLFTDPEKAKAMGQNGRKAVMDHYNWSAQASRMVAIYDELAK